MISTPNPGIGSAPGRTPPRRTRPRRSAGARVTAPARAARRRPLSRLGGSGGGEAEAVAGGVGVGMWRRRAGVAVSRAAAAAPPPAGGARRRGVAADQRRGIERDDDHQRDRVGAVGARARGELADRAPAPRLHDGQLGDDRPAAPAAIAARNAGASPAPAPVAQPDPARARRDPRHHLFAGGARRGRDDVQARRDGREVGGRRRRVPADDRDMRAPRPPQA